jgi:hypothetical protein
MEKEEKKFIHLLTETTGQYEDMCTHTICAYNNKEKAEKECKRLQEYTDKLYEEYKSIDFDVYEKKHAAFMELLKEINPEEYKRVKKAFEGKANEHTFDYDEFYIKEDEFFDTPELYDYLRKIGCTEEEIRLIDVEDEVANDLNYDFPSYNVSRPIELT